MTLHIVQVTLPSGDLMWGRTAVAAGRDSTMEFGIDLIARRGRGLRLLAEEGQGELRQRSRGSCTGRQSSG